MPLLPLPNGFGRMTPSLPPEPKVNVRPKTSFPPNKPSSYTMATALIGTAAGSAMLVEEPLYRTVAILCCAVAAYLIGLRTPA